MGTNVGEYSKHWCRQIRGRLMKFASFVHRWSSRFFARFTSPLSIIQEYRVVRRTIIVLIVTAAALVVSTGAYRLEESGILEFDFSSELLVNALLMLVAGYTFIRSVLLAKTRIHLCLRWICAALFFYGSAAFVTSLLSLSGVIDGSALELVVRFLLLTCMVSMFAIGILGPGLWRSPDRPRVVGGLIASGAIVGAVLWLTMATSSMTNDQSVGMFSLHELNIRDLPGWYLAAHGILIVVSLAILAVAVPSRSPAVSGDLLVTASGFFAFSVVYMSFAPVGGRNYLAVDSLLLLLAALTASVAVNWEIRRVRSTRRSIRSTPSSVPDNVVARAASRMEFSRLLIHELNSPIWAIQRFANVISHSELNEQQARAVLAIMNEVERLATISTDIEILAKFDRPVLSVRLEAHPLSAVIEDLRLFASSISPDHSVVITPAPDVLVRVDRDRIGQVLRNLLLNAAKYSPKGTRIRVETAMNDDRVSLSVVDEGSGVSDSDAERIFEPFTRARIAENSAIPGEGIGLYLSKSIVESHGSTLRLSSRADSGAAFSFDLEVKDVEVTLSR
jgi:signal transduction histidine kinase